MKKFVVIFFLLLTACSSGQNLPEPKQVDLIVPVNDFATEAETTVDSFDDPFYPTLGNEGYDVQRYEIALVVDPDSNHIQGQTTIYALAERDLVQFNLDLSGLTVEMVTINGMKAAFTREDHKLQILPAQVVPAGTEMIVLVRYAGFPQPVYDPIIGMNVGWQTGQGSIYVASEPSGAMTWFPCNNHWADKAEYAIRIAVPEGLEVISNGVETARETHAGQTMYTWESAQPMSTYLATVVIGDYEEVSQTSKNGVPVVNYFPVGTEEVIRVSFNNTPAMIDFYESIIGSYPFESYGVVLIGEPLGFALETQTRSLFGHSPADEEIVAHELAHQWFGDAVTITTWQDLWVKEGFATYLSYLWTEESRGEAAFETLIQEVYDAASISQFGVFFMPLDRIEPYRAQGLYGMETYQKAALMLHAFRRAVGDDLFFETLSRFSREYNGKTASGDNFLALAETVCSRDLNDVFEPWMSDGWLPPKP